MQLSATHSYEERPFGTVRKGAVMLADASGFTRLTQLLADHLATQENDFNATSLYGPNRVGPFPPLRDSSNRRFPTPRRSLLLRLAPPGGRARVRRREALWDLG
jgi:hypothetical protein